MNDLKEQKKELESQIKDINLRVNLRSILSIDDIFSRDELDNKLEQISRELNMFNNSPIYLTSTTI